jgi:hypothetical protein
MSLDVYLLVIGAFSLVAAARIRVQWDDVSALGIFRRGMRWWGFVGGTGIILVALADLIRTKGLQ